MSIQQVKRPLWLFFCVEDRPCFDIHALLTGELEAASEQPQIVALSLLGEAKHILAPDELRLLAGLPADSWSATAELDFDAGHLEELARKGLLVTDSDDSELARLRQRNDSLAAQQWHPYAAFYHFMTRQSAARSAEVKLPDTEVLAASNAEDAAEFVQRFGLPPSPFCRASSGAEVIDLPLIEKSGALYDVLRLRKTVRAFESAESLKLEDFTTLLRYVYGCHGYAQLCRDVVTLHKPSPSGGSLHPIEAYPLVLNVESLRPGLYHYDVRNHSLELIRRLELAEAKDLAVDFSIGQTYTGSAHALIVMTARFARTFWKYRHLSRSYSVVLMDAAHLSQTFYLVAAELGLGAFFTAAIDPFKIEEAFGLEAHEQSAIAICGCGIKAREGPDLGLDFQPFVPRTTVL